MMERVGEVVSDLFNPDVQNYKVGLTLGGLAGVAFLAAKVNCSLGTAVDFIVMGAALGLSANQYFGGEKVFRQAQQTAMTLFGNTAQAVKDKAQEVAAKAQEVVEKQSEVVLPANMTP